VKSPPPAASQISQANLVVRKVRQSADFSINSRSATALSARLGLFFSFFLVASCIPRPSPRDSMEAPCPTCFEARSRPPLCSSAQHVPQPALSIELPTNRLGRKLPLHCSLRPPHLPRLPRSSRWAHSRRSSWRHPGKHPDRHPQPVKHLGKPPSTSTARRHLWPGSNHKERIRHRRRPGSET
jgi:hypothetical protein